LNFSAGTAGTNYYVTVSANAVAGFLASLPSSLRFPKLTSVRSITPRTSMCPPPHDRRSSDRQFHRTHGHRTDFYSATACTDVAMTLNCVTRANYVSGSQFSGLTAGTNYYVVITANAPSGYLNSSVASAALCSPTSQLTTPTA